jgi:hypothetical protein
MKTPTPQKEFEDSMKALQNNIASLNRMARQTAAQAEEVSSICAFFTDEEWRLFTGSLKK